MCLLCLKSNRGGRKVSFNPVFIEDLPAHKSATTCALFTESRKDILLQIQREERLKKLCQKQ